MSKLRIDQSLLCPKCKIWNLLGSHICSECGGEIICYKVTEFNRKKKEDEEK